MKKGPVTTKKEIINARNLHHIDLDEIALAAMRGNGSALQEYLEGLGLEDRLCFLRKIAARSADLRLKDKSLPKVIVVVQWNCEEDVLIDSKINHHLEIKLCVEVAKLFAGDCIYRERLYVHNPELPRDVVYSDAVMEARDKKKGSEVKEPFENRNLTMSIRVIESLMLRHDIEDKQTALEKLKDIEWLKHEGYGHIAHVLSGPSGEEACERIFSDESRE